MNRRPNHPATVEFKKIECCALRHATSNRVHCEFVRDSKARRVIKEIFDDNICSFFSTGRLLFIPRSEHRVYYFELATRELKYLNSLGIEVMECGHKKTEHTEALEKVMALMLMPHGQN